MNLSPADKYQLEQIKNSTPQELMYTLLIALYKNVLRLQMALAARDPLSAKNTVTRISDLISECTKLFNFNSEDPNDLEFIKALDKLFKHWIVVISASAVSNDLTRLEKIAAEIIEIKDAWQQKLIK